MPSRKGPRPGKGSPRTRQIRKAARAPARYPAKPSDDEVFASLVALRVSEIIGDQLADVTGKDGKVYVSTQTAVDLHQLNLLKVRSQAKNLHVMGREEDLILILDF